MPLPHINLATFLLTNEGKTVEDYTGWCSTVADNVTNEFGGSIVYVDGEACDLYDWRYHAVPLVNGKIHDAWLEAWHQISEPLPLPEWLVKMFGKDEEISVTIDGDDIYSGLTQNFNCDYTSQDANFV